MTLLPESLSAELQDSRKPAPTSANALSRIDPHHIEIKTLVQPLGQQADANLRHDQALADALNAGWELLNLTVTTAETYSTVLLHTRIITLHRLVEAPEPSDAGATVEVPETQTQTASAAVGTFVPAGWMRIGTAAPDSAAAVGILVNADDLTFAEILATPILAPPISYAEALLSGRYSPEAIREIAQREAAEAGIRAAWAQQQSRSGMTWESLLFRPQSVERVSAQTSLHNE